MSGPPRIAELADETPRWMLETAEAAGALLVELGDADSVLWGGSVPPERLRSIVETHGRHLDWVQLPWAGVEPYLGFLDEERVWTCAKGAYGDDVAEMALALTLAGLRAVPTYARATSWRADGELGSNLGGATVCIVGGGGITEHLVRLLGPFECRISVVRRRTGPMEGVERVLPPAGLDAALAEADVVVLALALTPETEGIIDARRLASMRPGAWLVNVARGGHVVTDDLVDALTAGRIGGAALDVTDPEPLPDGHPLWSLPNCIVTPHVANTSAMLRPRLAERIRENVRRRARGEELLGVVDIRAGY